MRVSTTRSAASSRSACTSAWKDRQAAVALAGSGIDAITRAILLWEQEGDLSLGAALDMTWEGTIRASRLLAGTMGAVFDSEV